MMMEYGFTSDVKFPVIKRCKDWKNSAYVSGRKSPTDKQCACGSELSVAGGHHVLWCVNILNKRVKSMEKYMSENMQKGKLSSHYRVRLFKAWLSMAALASCFFVPVAHAEWVILKLNAVGSDTSGNVLLQFAPGSFNSCGCLVFSGATAGGKQMLSLATAALMADKSIYVNRGGSAPSNVWGIPDTTNELRIVK